jgi:hypothetical protein
VSDGQIRITNTYLNGTVFSNIIFCPSFSRYQLSVISILLIPTQESSINGLMSEINRTAIDSSGRLGSLYDGYRDLVLEPLNINDTKLTQQRLGTARCSVIKGTYDQNQNILKTISIEEELRLSILLNLSKKTGTAKTIDYCHSVNEHTRFFLYLYLNREVQLPNDPRKIEVFNQLAMSFSHATQCGCDQRRQQVQIDCR